MIPLRTYFENLNSKELELLSKGKFLGLCDLLSPVLNMWLSWTDWSYVFRLLSVYYHIKAADR